MPDPISIAHHLPLTAANIIAELASAGITPTPLNIIAHATDRGLTDADIGIIIRELNEAAPRS